MVTANQAKDKWSENTTESAFSSGVSSAGASAYDDGVSNSSNQEYLDGVTNFLNSTGGPGGTATEDYDWQSAASGSGSNWQSEASAAASDYAANTGSDEAEDWLAEYARAYQS